MTYPVKDRKAALKQGRKKSELQASRYSGVNTEAVNQEVEKGEEQFILHFSVPSIFR